MATTTKIPICFKCQKTKSMVTCKGCSKDFCLPHMNEHHNELSDQLTTIEDQFNNFTIAITKLENDSSQHEIVRQIDVWEVQSIEKIRTLANEIRSKVSSSIKNFASDLEEKLMKLSQKVLECRKEGDFIDTDIQYFSQSLQQLKDLLNSPQKFTIEQEQAAFIGKIYLTQNVPHGVAACPTLSENTKWKQDGITVAGGNGTGSAMNQLANPWGLFVDDEAVYVADCDNHRIMEWKAGETTGRVVAGGNGAGTNPNQLNLPTDVIIDKQRKSFIIAEFSNKRVVQWPYRNGLKGEIIISNTRCFGLQMDKSRNLYVVDYDGHHVKQYREGENQGKCVAGNNGGGSRLNQLFSSRYAYVDRQQSVYVADCSNNRVMKWEKDGKEGIVVAGGQGSGNSLAQLSNPYGICVDSSGNVYVADSGNHRIVRWIPGAKQGMIIVGGNSGGSGPNQLSTPCSVTFDRHGNLYVVDNGNSRVQKFKQLCCLRHTFPVKGKAEVPAYGVLVAIYGIKYIVKV